MNIYFILSLCSEIILTMLHLYFFFPEFSFNWLLLQKEIKGRDPVFSLLQQHVVIRVFQQEFEHELSFGPFLDACIYVFPDKEGEGVVVQLVVSLQVYLKRQVEALHLPSVHQYLQGNFVMLHHQRIVEGRVVVNVLGEKVIDAVVYFYSCTRQRDF